VAPISREHYIQRMKIPLLNMTRPKLWFVCGILLMSGLSQAAAADASAWDKDTHSAVRLIAGNTAAGSQTMQAGVSLAIEDGWKTYWRYPGDSGVPPRFDFSGSDNVGAVTVAWPAPQGFEDGGGISIGYKHDVVFPLKITPREPGKPVVLKLKAEYAVCENLCVPATGKAELTLDGRPSSLAGAVADAQAKVPQAAAPGAAGDLSLVSLHRENGTPKQQAIVDIRAAPDEKLQIFVEGPSPAWALPLPRQQSGAPAGQQRFVFALDGVPSGATLKGTELRFTIVGKDNATDVRARLD
jgi:DsbC/DsbD-like thiol-disulfide interchange protein